MSGLTPAQKELRKTGVGASEIAALIGISKWATPIAIYEAKVHGFELESSYAMELGTEFEAPIARIWARREKRFIAIVDTLRHPDPSFPFAIATPDRAVYTSAAARGDGRRKQTRAEIEGAEKILQVKSTNWRMRHLWGDEGTDSIPDEYVAASHWEGAVAGKQIVDFAVDFDKTELKTYRVIVDLGIFAAMHEIAARFMIDHVQARKPPDPDSTERYHEFLTRMFPRQTTEDFDPVAAEEADILQAIEIFAKLKAGEKRIEALKRLARNKIEARIGGAAGIKGSFGKISWKKTKDKAVVDWKKVADESMRIAGVVVNTLPEGDMRAELAADLRKLIDESTTPKVGHRMMRPTWSDSLQLDAQVIELRLEAATAALAASNEEVQGDE